MAHGNSKRAMLMRVIDLRMWLADTPDTNIAMVEYYQAEIEKLMKRIYRQENIWKRSKTKPVLAFTARMYLLTIASVATLASTLSHAKQSCVKTGYSVVATMLISHSHMPIQAYTTRPTRCPFFRSLSSQHAVTFITISPIIVIKEFPKTLTNLTKMSVVRGYNRV